MGGWGELHGSGIGTTRQIEDAHSALDAVGIGPGPVAIRAMEAAGAIDRLRLAGSTDRLEPTTRAYDIFESLFFGTLTLVLLIVLAKLVVWLV